MEKICAEVPREFQRGIRACRSCKLIKTFEQFLENGCDNCSALSFTDSNAVVKLTTSNYSGVITILAPKHSWTARWLHLGPLKPGCYALELNEREQADILI